MTLLPLVFVYLVFGMGISVFVFLVSMVMLKYELSLLLVTRNYSKVHINKYGNWVVTDQGGNSRDIEFEKSMRIGSSLFLLITLEGRAKRVLVLENQQDDAQFHRLMIYLPDINRAKK